MKISEDRKLLNNALNNLHFALLDVYTMETIAGFELERLIIKAKEEGERLIEEDEV